jgi:hypothetical protein
VREKGVQVGAAEGDDQNNCRDDEQSGDLTAEELVARGHVKRD